MSTTDTTTARPARVADDGAPGSDTTVASLVYDLLEWVGDDGRGYEEVMDAWRTSCPRLPVWEEACRLGYVVVEPAPPGRRVAVSDAGRRVLDRPRRQQPEKQRADA